MSTPAFLFWPLGASGVDTTSAQLWLFFLVDRVVLGAMEVEKCKRLRDFSEKILNRALIRAEWIAVREREGEWVV